MDGGSNDGSREIIERYAEELTYWQSEPDGGQSRAIAEGFRRASGGVVGWLNSDDILTPGSLQRLERAVLKHGSPNAVFFGGHYVIDEHGIVQEIYLPCKFSPWIALRIGPCICQPGTFFDREAYFRVGGVDPSLQYGMDLDLWFKFMKAGMSFVTIRAIQAGFRRYPLQKGHSRDHLKICVAEESMLYDKYGVSAFSDLERKRAFRRLRVMKLFNGEYITTFLFRLLKHRRLNSFQASYT